MLATITIEDVTDLDSTSGFSGLAGGKLTATFEDLSDGNGGIVISGTSPIGGCVVVRFDASHVPHGHLDEGAITVANSPSSESPATGLLQTVGPCGFNSGQYLCASNVGSNATVTAVGSNSTSANTAQYAWTGTPFAGETLTGSWLVINGFSTTQYNSGTSAWPIVGESGGSALLTFNPAATLSSPEVASAASYDVLNAFGPVPTGADFLGAGSIAISKPAGAAWGAISQTFDVPGDGWTLSDPGDPTALPLTGTASSIKFGCGNNTPSDSTDDTCGDGTTGTRVTMVWGRATQQSVTSLTAYQMPDEAPGTTSWLEFQCTAVASPSVTLTQAALQTIIDFVPTRVETRVTTGAFVPLSDGQNQGTILVGHTIVGHTDHP